MCQAGYYVDHPMDVDWTISQLTGKMLRIWENLEVHYSHKGFLGGIELAVGTNRSGMFFIGQGSGFGDLLWD